MQEGVYKPISFLNQYVYLIILRYTCINRISNYQNPWTPQEPLFRGISPVVFDWIHGLSQLSHVDCL